MVRMKQYQDEGIEFTKMSGAGNDFVVLDNRKGVVTDPAALARELCNRRSGIGADGLLLLELSDRADFLMRYYNSDGSYGGMCGNGGRCISRYAYIKRIVNRPEMRFEALEHVYSASILTDSVRLRMKNPLDFRLGQMIKLSQIDLRFHFVNSGSPHCVIFLDENHELGSTLEGLDVPVLGREIRNHKYFIPDGTNVNFVEKIDARCFTVRTYERGVEEETLACGTGSVAVALIANQVKESMSPISLQVRSGETLTVEFEKTGNTQYENVTLNGSAHVVFNGKIMYDFSSQSILDIV